MMVSSASGVFRIRPERSKGQWWIFMCCKDGSVGSVCAVKMNLLCTCHCCLLSSVLTHHQLLDLLPLYVISCLVCYGNCDPPLDALWTGHHTGSQHWALNNWEIDSNQLPWKCCNSLPGEGGRFHGKACHLCGPPLRGYSWGQTQNKCTNYMGRLWLLCPFDSLIWTGK